MAGSTAGTEAQAPHGSRIVVWLSKVFELHPAGANWPRAVLFLDVALVPLVVFWAIGYEQYLLSAVFGVLFALLVDPGGSYGYRASHIGVFALLGAGVTALGFGLGGSAWGWLVLAASAVTLVAGLAVKFGAHRFLAALLLNTWFIIVLGLAVSFHHESHLTDHTWAQVVAWVGGSALWIALSFVGWLARGRRDRPAPMSEFPGDTSLRKLTRPLVLYALVRALGVAGSVAIAFGFALSHGYWIAIAAVVATKPSFEQSVLAGAQRIAGALIGAAAAALLLLIPTHEHGLRLLTVDHGLEVVAIILFMHAAGIRFVNYALYYATTTAAVLTLVEMLQPTNHGGEGDRVLWALCGVGIGVLVMLVTGVLAKYRPKPPAEPTPADRPQGHSPTLPQPPPSPVAGTHKAHPGG
jgi:hypothetical protein